VHEREALNMTAVRLPATIITESEENWTCDCGNNPFTGLGFLPLITGNEPVIYVQCLECGLVMDQTTFDAVTQTVAVVDRIPIAET
jgi:uncharacterized Zn finger protein